jgi:glucosamine kinase
VIVVGIDGGGTSCRVVAATDDGSILFRHTAGPVNASAADVEFCVRQLAEATAGCPDEPEVVGACFAGLSDARAAALIKAALRARFPHATMRLAADHVAALLARPDADICVIAGTGSAIASLVGGQACVSGGHGPLIGDHGSGLRYGQAVLDRVLTRPSPEIATAVTETIGTADRRGVISAVSAAPAPAALVGRLAPILTSRAGTGEAWALEVIDHESRLLAGTLAAHVDRYHPGAKGLEVSLVGGVWQSEVAVDGFRRAIPQSVHLANAPTDPVLGALRLARMDGVAASLLIG